jgi:hemoglobin/transferrin/lactoferrin receptor protein
VFGNVAGGFRAPNANQINGYYENTGVQVVIVPNPDLKPEKSRSAELGMRARLGRVSADVAVFGSRFTNLILDNVLIGGTGTAGDPQLFQTRNTDKARIEGFEIKGRVEAGSLLGGQLDIPFAYGQSHGVNLTTGKPLNSIDPAQLSLGLDWRWAAWDVRLDLRHHEAKNAGDIDSPLLVKAPNTQFTIPGSTTLDISSQWRIRKDLRLTASIVNVTNRKYWLWSDVQALAASSTVTDAYTQPGRHGRISVVADF